MLKPLKAWTKAVVSPLVDSTGVFHRRIRRYGELPGHWIIVMYHRIIDDASQDPYGLGMCVMRDRFDRQVRYLRENFHILTVREAVARLEREEPLPPRALSITFDDGYRDTFTRALPVLQRHQAPFSVYVPTGGMDEGEPLWWDRVIAAVARSPRTEIRLADWGLGDDAQTLDLKGLQASSHVEVLLERLWALPLDQHEQVLDRLLQWLGPADARDQQALRLTPQEVQYLHAQGAEIGAHSVTHPNLALSDDTRCVAELAGSRRTLEGLLQAEVTGFAHPAGKQDARVQQTARQLGFAYALGTQVGICRAQTPRFNLARIGMPDAEMPDFRRAFGAALKRGAAHAAVRF